jgi:hypothetical protein
MRTTNEMRPLHPRMGILTIGPLKVAVRVLDSRQVFSRVDCLVTPLNGAGQQWVSTDRLSEGRELCAE